MTNFILEEYSMGDTVVEVYISAEKEVDEINVGGTPDNIETRVVLWNVLDEITGIYGMNQETGYYEVSLLDYLDLNVIGFQEVINGKTVFTLFKDDMMAKARELFDGEIEE